MSLTKSQAKCVNTFDRPLVVAAGAGSGKTFTLTKRIAQAFEDGIVSDIGEVCAITFTTKAAGELKSRVKAELRACGRVDQALKVDEAWISTIHGLCSRILAAHAIEFGIDPAFSVLGEDKVSDYLDAAVDEVLVEAREGELSGALNALFEQFAPRSQGVYGTSVEKMILSLVKEASSHEQGGDTFVLPRFSMEPAYALDQAIGTVEGLLAGAEQAKASKTRDEWIAVTPQRIADARSVLDAGVDDPIEALGAIAAMKLPGRFGGPEFRAQVAEARLAVSALAAEMRLRAAQPHLELLVELACRALDRYTRAKRQDGVLDNNDLLVFASRALEGNAAVASQYADKFKLVMVDEFQDTDQMQVDMIKRIAGQGACRLCTVGDAQQSIYRFRGADVSVYRRHLESVASTWDDAVINLFDNFRSHRDVLAFVDRVFEQPSMFGGRFMSLSAGRDEARVDSPFDSSTPRVIVQHTKYARGNGDAASARAFAARRIARQFAAFAHDGHSASEMVVLLGVTTYADVYAQALRDEGLSCVMSGGSVFAGAYEVSVIRSLLHALVNPAETQHVFDVLTSPLFALSAGDLLTAGRFGGFKRAAASGDLPDGCSARLACAIQVMGRAWGAVGALDMSRIVERVVVESGWLSRLQQGGAEDLAVAANVMKAIRLVASVEGDGACGPASAMERFDQKLATSKEAPGALSVSDGNSVRIMTVHASKGLEFPIVAVAEMKRTDLSLTGLASSTVDGDVYVSLEGGASADAAMKLDVKAKQALYASMISDGADEDDLAARIKGDATALGRWLALSGFEGAGNAEEAKRLLYVALTRAKEAVVVSMVGRQSASSNPLGMPENVLRGVYTALDREGGGFSEGITHCEYGGALPAVFESMSLAAGDEGEPHEEGGAALGGGALLQTPAAAGQGASFMVPVVDSGSQILPDVYRPMREGVFSYSSVSDAAHGGDVLARLAEAHTRSIDASASVGSLPADDAGMSDVLFGVEQTWNAPVAGDSSGFDVSAAYDEDRATDLGTAFHRLAQYAVSARSRSGALIEPPADRVEALALTCNLDRGQRARLNRALERWFASDVAHDMAALPFLAAEVPFFVAVGGGFLEGEIDLIGYDDARSHAYVVDYKTGGADDEDADTLACKHVLQAACYAYAVMLQGADLVDAAFVRVERARAGAPYQPQCVRYRFEQSDLADLEILLANMNASKAALTS